MWQAKIIAHSICAYTQKEIITWELVYPRFIHSELMTHRLFSRNAASSRAIPVQKVIDMVRTGPASPVHWGKNQAGMQANEELEGAALNWTQSEWMDAANDAANHAEKMALYGAHKQVVNRILEPFQWMKTVVTYTEGTNWFWLRNHPAADPNIKRLAEYMYDQWCVSIPNTLYPGEWHTPYYRHGYWVDWNDGEDADGVVLQDALNISMSCTAQVSYRTLDDTIEKAERVVERLNLGVDLEEPCHASPSEHQATPMEKTDETGDLGVKINVIHDVDSWEDGITAYHKELGFMSGNFAGWIQNRQLIKGHTRW